MGEIMFDEFNCITIFDKHNLTIFVKLKVAIFLNMSQKNLVLILVLKKYILTSYYGF